MLKQRSYIKSFVVLLLISLLAVVAGCSSEDRGAKKAYKELLKYQQERFPVSNKELKIKYPKWKDLGSGAITVGRNTHREPSYSIIIGYEFDESKVGGTVEPRQGRGTNRVEARVELLNGKYEVTSYMESRNIRFDLDD